MRLSRDTHATHVIHSFDSRWFRTNFARLSHDNLTNVTRLSWDCKNYTKPLAFTTWHFSYKCRMISTRQQKDKKAMNPSWRRVVRISSHDRFFVARHPVTNVVQHRKTSPEIPPIFVVNLQIPVVVPLWPGLNLRSMICYRPSRFSPAPRQNKIKNRGWRPFCKTARPMWL